MSSASSPASSMHGIEKARVAVRISGNCGTRSSGGGGRWALYWSYISLRMGVLRRVEDHRHVGRPAILAGPAVEVARQLPQHRRIAIDRARRLAVAVGQRRQPVIGAEDVARPVDEIEVGLGSRLCCWLRGVGHRLCSSRTASLCQLSLAGYAARWGIEDATIPAFAHRAAAVCRSSRGQANGESVLGPFSKRFTRLIKAAARNPSRSASRPDIMKPGSPGRSLPRPKPPTSAEKPRSSTATPSATARTISPFKAKIAPMQLSGNRAKTVVTFVNGRPQRLEIELIATKAGWRIYDIRTSNYRLRSLLKL